MSVVVMLIALSVICVIWNVVTSLIIYDALQRCGIRVSFLWLRMLAPKYASQYKEITKAETGRVGPLFYHWIVSINLAWIFAIAAIISRF
jgi:hypothetical protein